MHFYLTKVTNCYQDIVLYLDSNSETFLIYQNHLKLLIVISTYSKILLFQVVISLISATIKHKQMRHTASSGAGTGFQQKKT